MRDVKDIAKWFISNADGMTNTKLQLLCYYAQAWFCSEHDGRPLFNDDIVALGIGPVIPTLCPIYDDYENMCIPQLKYDGPELDEEELKILESVQGMYKEMSGTDMSVIVRSEKPWLDAWTNRSTEQFARIPITCEALAKYYKPKVIRYEEWQNKPE